MPEELKGNQVKDNLGAKIDSFKNKVNKEFNDQDRLRIINALQLMSEIHAGQHRPLDRIPYATHPLIVASKALDYMGKKDPDAIIAALLHDTVEDQPERLAAKINPNYNSQNVKEFALNYIQNVYGEQVFRIVSAISNPDFDEEIRGEGKTLSDNDYLIKRNELYVKHVSEAIEDPNVFLIKYCDVEDNFFELKEKKNDHRQELWQKKYQPLTKIFLQRLKKDKGEINLKPAIKQKIIEKLKKKVVN